MKVFLLAFDAAFGTMLEVRQMIDASTLIAGWRYDLPNCIYFTSVYDANTLVTSFRTIRPNGYFIVAEISSDPSRSNGWLTPDSWYFIQHQQLKPQPPPPPPPNNPWGLFLNPPQNPPPPPPPDWWRAR